MNRNELDAFYRATAFVVQRPDGIGIAIRIGQTHAALDDLIQSLGATWAFLTACNPRSEILPAAENARRMEALRSDLLAAGYVFWPGAGVSDFTDWPQEESVLAVGVTNEQANVLAERYDQNAYVYGERGGTAQLVWTASAAG